ncbi:response regulator [Leptospira wolffii]|uniref:Histidine kinase n=1 Tax=Leptospira wolffii TaxID=409998 RepID=A0A2M9Z7S4_9LEPT|nr:histidine kinase dimerization/phosphoacceptor domain -containing protein [Leptospira wolffii]PJZ64417.1 histidine kinase [Leptospira wolffii]TGK54825.1 response regulator [Leptospira wolffii]TGK65358.1 response regulator [Leptospira wolffii]TGK70748.1 response regulator [Leptospira wolffii]TGL26443.1 response regulator [Leptospira wolffii]
MLAKPKILVVEDEIIVAVNLGQKLKKLGYDLVGITSSGEEAIQKAEENHPDLVLMDINIEGNLDGIQTAELLRNRFQTPVIYLTAYADENTLNRAKRTQPLGYIVKPFESDQLRSSIEVALYKNELEHRSRKNEESLKSTLNHLESGIITTDENGLVIFCNPVAEKIIGLSYPECIGQPLTKILKLEESNSVPFSVPISEVLGSHHSVEKSGIFAVDAGGNKTFLSYSISPILNTEGKSTGTITVLRMGDSDETNQSYLKEIHHRIKNNLTVISSLLSMNASNLKDQESLDVFKDSQHRIQAVALLHEVLYENHDLSSISFDLYVRKLTDLLFEVYKVDREKFKLSLDIQASRIPSEMGMNCALIINELLTNSFKHGFKDKEGGSISIRFSLDDGLYSMEVKDDGNGFKGQIFPGKNSGSLGLSLVDSFVKLLRGKITLEGDNGCKALLTFPAKHES